MKHLQSKQSRGENWRRNRDKRDFSLDIPGISVFGVGREGGGRWSWAEVWVSFFSQKSGNFGGSLDREEAEFSFKVKNKLRSSDLVIKSGEY